MGLLGTWIIRMEHHSLLIFRIDVICMMEVMLVFDERVPPCSNKSFFQYAHYLEHAKYMFTINFDRILCQPPITLTKGSLELGPSTSSRRNVPEDTLIRKQ